MLSIKYYIMKFCYAFWRLPSIMPTRPYIQYTIDQLQSLYEDNDKNVTILKQLSEELQHRKRPKAVALRTKIDEVLKHIANGTSPHSQQATKQPAQMQQKPNPTSPKPALIQESLFGNDNTVGGQAATTAATESTVNFTACSGYPDCEYIEKKKRSGERKKRSLSVEP